MNIANPFNPLVSASYTDAGNYGSANSIAVSGHFVCTVGNDFKVFDISQPNHPALVGQLSVIGGGKVVARNGVAFVDAGSAIEVINIAIPSSPQLVTAIPYTTVYSYRMSLVGRTLYVVGQNTSNQPRFVAIDISNPFFPSVLGTKDFTSLGNGIASSIAVNGNKAVVGTSTGTFPLSILDISNIRSPVELGSLTHIDAQNVRISADGHYVYVIDYNHPDILHTVDISNPANPLIGLNLPLDDSKATSLEVRGDELYAATLRGLYVFDISGPASPVLTRSYSMDAIAEISVPGDSPNQSGNIYLADRDGGVAVLKEQDIEAPNIFITNPSFSPVYTNATSSLGLGGGADDNAGVTRAIWSNNRGGGGEVSSPFDNWFVSGIKLLPGTNLLTVTVFDAAGNSSSDTLTAIYLATNQNQTITFPALTDKTFGAAPVNLAAAASSGLEVQFQVTTGPATISGNVLTIVGAGIIIVRATQPGDGQFNTAPPVTNSFNVAKADQAITFELLSDKSVGAAPFAVSATAGSGLLVTFSISSGPATVFGNVVTLTGAGSVTVRASQSGNTNFNAALDVERSFFVAKLPQFITFGALSRQVFGDAPFALSATASSGLTVSFSVLSGPAIVSGKILTLTLTGSGLVVLRASQAGDATNAPAPNVDQVFIVAPGSNVITDVHKFENSMFAFRFYGELGTSYVVQGSIDLVNWLPLATNQVSGLGYLEFIDRSGTNSDRSFYRTVVLP